MFQSIVISPDPAVSGGLVQALQETGHVTVSKCFAEYPQEVDLVRTLRAHATEIVFLSFESLENALETLRMLEDAAAHAHVVGFHKALDANVLQESMRAGVREFITAPFEQSVLIQSLVHLKILLEKHPVRYAATDQIFSFIPAKAGAGTSTIAVNVAAAMTRIPNTRVLLGDFDLSSGMTRFMLKLTNEHSVTDAVEHASQLDENLWPQLISSVEGMDVLHSGHLNPNLRIDPGQIRGLVAFMRRNYGALCFDLSGNLEKYSLELMQESKRILMVCTPEIPSLHLAREKMAFLAKMDLDHRVAVIVTRIQKKNLLSEEEVAEVVGAPVIRVFPNDYAGVQHALEHGTLLSADSELGSAFADFAGVLMEQKVPPKPAAQRRRFLEFISSGPALAFRSRP